MEDFKKWDVYFGSPPPLLTLDDGSRNFVAETAALPHVFEFYDSFYVAMSRMEAKLSS